MSDISDEAVEAVARAMQHWCEYGTIHLLGHVPKNWDEDDPDWWMGLARAALTAAYSYLLDEDWRTDWENDLLANAPEWLDDDVAQCEIVTRYVRWLEDENARLRSELVQAKEERNSASKRATRLADAVDILRAQVEAVRALHQPRDEPNSITGDLGCRMCWIRWPCPTIAALSDEGKP